MGRDRNRCVVTILSLVGAGTVLFGFIQVCEACAPQTAEHLRNVCLYCNRCNDMMVINTVHNWYFE